MSIPDMAHCEKRSKLYPHKTCAYKAQYTRIVGYRTEETKTEPHVPTRKLGIAYGGQ